MKRLFLMVVGLVLILSSMSCAPSTPTPTPEKEKPFSEQAVTETTVHNAIQDLSGTDVVLGKSITKIEVFPHGGTADPNDVIVHIYFHPDAIWDEEDAMEKAVHTSIKAMEVLFQNDKVSEVVMWEELDFTDKYGETKTETAIRLTMEKEVADRIMDWEKVDDRAWADYNTFFDLAELQYVHPAIMRGL